MLEKEYDIPTQANPDFFDQHYDTFTIADARELKRLHSTRPIGETGKKVFIMSVNSITVEAQNALLKLFEEPAEYAHFFLIVPSAHILLPTVKSRMQEWRSDVQTRDRAGKTDRGVMGDVDPELLKTAQKLVTSSKAKRLEEIKKLVDDIAKDKKSTQDAINLLNALQVVVREEWGVKEGRDRLEAIEYARSYMYDRAPSVKMLLEYVMLNV